MAHQFTETAPGVHTATLVDPKSNKSHNIALIDSAGAWQLFIDGEISVRNLPNFKAAVTAAEAKILTPGASPMIRIACALVLASVVGASLIGVSKFIGTGSTGPGQPDFASTETSAAAVAAAPQKFQRVLPPPIPQIAPKEQASASAPAPGPALEPVIRTVAITVSETPPESSTEAAPHASPDAAPERAPSPAQARRFSAEHPLNAPSVSKSANSKSSSDTRAEVATVQIPVIINAPQTPTVSPALSDVRATTEDNAPPQVSATTNAAEPPPIPVILSLASQRPVIRTASPKITAALLAEIEREESASSRDTTEPDRTASSKRQLKNKRKNRLRLLKATQKRAAKRTSRPKSKSNSSRRYSSKKSRVRTRSARKSQRVRVQKARIQQPRKPARIARRDTRRMVCFAHSCRFR